ncbi:MAG: hypothetical protein E4H24_01915 [Thermomicrobiales bacterium]|jgi:hypothetical protein|nr:MAG: hypothetical protein E4H24_01915 [Thermomicrobiales bacterium]
MNDIIILLPIAAFIALAAGLAVVLRGTGRIVARTREVDQFRAGVKGLAARIDVSLGTAASEIDALRRRQVDPEAIATTVTSTKDAVEVYLEEARALKCPGEARQIQSSIVTDLERAQRALGMVEHGTTIMATARRGPRELEAQTSVKRGYLNLIHAREAMARHALDAQEFATEDQTGQAGRRVT